MSYIQIIFADAGNTGKVEGDKLFPSNMKAAMQEVGYDDFLPDRASAHPKEVWSYDARWLGFVLGPAAPKELITIDVPTLKGRFERDFEENRSARRLMRRGFRTVAQALHMQRSGQGMNSVLINTTLYTAGGAFKAGFDFLVPEKQGGDPKYRISRQEGSLIARRLYNAGLKQTR